MHPVLNWQMEHVLFYFLKEDSQVFSSRMGSADLKLIVYIELINRI